MKRIISLFIVALLCTLSATVITSANAEIAASSVVIVSEGVEYTVEFENTSLSDEQQQAIAEKLIYGDIDNIQTYGLMCTLFGHKTEQNTVGVITHKVRTSSPRCKRELYLVTTCTRCDYQEQELTSTSYIVCCPVD